MFCFFTSAEPWIDTSNIYLRSSIQQLADAGHIKTPVTTFPLMWLDIGRDLKHVDYSSLNSSEKQAFDYVNHQFRMAKNNSKKEASISLFIYQIIKKAINITTAIKAKPFL